MRTNAEKIASSDSVSLRSARSSAKANACVTSFVSVRSASVGKKAKVSNFVAVNLISFN